MRRVGLLMLVGLAFGVAPATAAQAAMTPKQLGDRLLIATYKNLPDGFYGTGKVTLGDKPDRKGWVTSVDVEVSGPDALDQFSFDVYDTVGSALYVLTHPRLNRSEDGVSSKARVIGRAPGWGKQSVMMVGTVTGENVFGKKVKNGFTILAVLRGNVLVTVVTTSTSSETSGNVTSARQLLAYAVKQLDRVRNR